MVVLGHADHRAEALGDVLLQAAYGACAAKRPGTPAGRPGCALRGSVPSPSVKSKAWPYSCATTVGRRERT